MPRAQGKADSWRASRAVLCLGLALALPLSVTAGNVTVTFSGGLARPAPGLPPVAVAGTSGLYMSLTTSASSPLLNQAVTVSIWRTQLMLTPSPSPPSTPTASMSPPMSPTSAMTPSVNTSATPSSNATITASMAATISSSVLPTSALPSPSNASTANATASGNVTMASTPTRSPSLAAFSSGTPTSTGTPASTPSPTALPTLTAANYSTRFVSLLRNGGPGGPESFVLSSGAGLYFVNVFSSTWVNESVAACTATAGLGIGCFLAVFPAGVDPASSNISAAVNTSSWLNVAVLPSVSPSPSATVFPSATPSSTASATLQSATVTPTVTGSASGTASQSGTPTVSMSPLPPGVSFSKTPSSTVTPFVGAGISASPAATFATDKSIKIAYPQPGTRVLFVSSASVTVPVRWVAAPGLGGQIAFTCSVTVFDAGGQPYVPPQGGLFISAQFTKAIGDGFANVPCPGPATISSAYGQQGLPVPPMAPATLRVIVSDELNVYAQVSNVQLVLNPAAAASVSPLPPFISGGGVSFAPPSASPSSPGALMVPAGDGVSWRAAPGASFDLTWSLAISPAPLASRGSGMLSLWSGQRQVAILSNTVDLGAGRASAQVAWGLGLAPGTSYYLMVTDPAMSVVYASSATFIVDTSVGSPTSSPSPASAAAAAAAAADDSKKKIIYYAAGGGIGLVLIIVVVIIVVRCCRSATKVATVKSKHLRARSERRDEEDSSDEDDKDKRNVVPAGAMPMGMNGMNGMHGSMHLGMGGMNGMGGMPNGFNPMGMGAMGGMNGMALGPEHFFPGAALRLDSAQMGIQMNPLSRGLVAPSYKAGGASPSTINPIVASPMFIPSITMPPPIVATPIAAITAPPFMLTVAGPSAGQANAGSGASV